MCADVSDDDYEEDDYSLDGFDYERIYQKVREDNKKAEIAKELEEKQARKLQEIANLLREIPERERRFLNNEIPFHEMTQEEQKIAAQDPSLQPTSEDNPDWYKKADAEKEAQEVCFRHTHQYLYAPEWAHKKWKWMERELKAEEMNEKGTQFFKSVRAQEATKEEFLKTEDYIDARNQILHDWDHLVFHAVQDAISQVWEECVEDDSEDSLDEVVEEWDYRGIYDAFFERRMKHYRDIYFDKIQRLNREYEAELECQQEQMTEKNGTTGSTKNIGT